MTDEQLIETAKEAVNAAVSPYGFTAESFDSSTDLSEIWLMISFTDKSKQTGCSSYFEAVYYTRPNKWGKKGGDIAYGIMDNDWIDLPEDPAKACKVFARWSQQKTLEQIIAEVNAEN